MSSQNMKQDTIAGLMTMGFTQNQIDTAFILNNNNYDMEQVLNIILQTQDNDDVSPNISQEQQEIQPPQPAVQMTNIKLVYCDDNTGIIDCNTFQTSQFPSDCSFKDIANQLESKMDENKNDDDDTPLVHIWIKLGIAKAIYPVDKRNCKVTEDDLKSEDSQRWVEIPDDYLKTKVFDIFDENNGDPLIIIEKSQVNNGNRIWPRAKGNDWKTNIEVGDIIDALDTQDKWYESVIRYIYPSADEHAGKIAVHFIGWNIKWDERILIINTERVAKRHTHTHGPYRPKKRDNNNASGYGGGSWTEHENGAPAHKGVVGLRNLGNTCFMNSVIQCLSQTPQLTDYFLQNNYIHDVNKINPLGYQGKMAGLWATLLHDMYSDKYKVMALRQFKNVIGEIAPRFTGYQQQDAKEFLSFLMNGLHEDLNLIQKKPFIENTMKLDGKVKNESVAMEIWKNHLMRNESVMVDLFQTHKTSKVSCPDCGNKSITFDPDLVLSVPIPSEKYKVIEYTLVDNEHVFYELLTIGFIREIESKYNIVMIKEIKLIILNECMLLPATVFGIGILKVGDIGMLKEAVAKRHNFNIDELYVCDIWKSKIHRELRKHDSVCDINRKSDDIFIFRSKFPINISNKADITTHVLQSQRRIAAGQNPDNETRYEDEPIGFPLLVTFASKTGITLAQIRNKLWYQIKPFLKDENMKLNDDNLPFTMWAAWGFNNHLKIEDTQDLFDLNQRNLKFIIHWAEPKQYKQEIYKYENRNKDESAPQPIDSNTSDHVGRGAKPIELLTCIDAYCEKEILTQDAAWYCSMCKQHKCGEKNIDIWNLSDVLIIHLKRFHYTSNYRDRVNTLVKFPIQGLDLGKYITSDDEKEKDNDNNNIDAIYDCFAILNHMGGMGGGHYTAYGKSLYDNEWYHFDDSRTSKVTNINVIVSSAAYVLFYYKRNPQKRKHTASMIKI